MKEKNCIFSSIIRENRVLFFYHDPGFAAGGVAEGEGGIVFCPVAMDPDSFRLSGVSMHTVPSGDER